MVFHICTGLPHGFNDLVQRHFVLAFNQHRQPLSIDGFDGGHGITFNSSRCTIVYAARIGPAVCELEGLIPILNNSKTLTAMSCFPKYARGDSNLWKSKTRIKMSQLILYYQPDCHLCDEAKELLHASGLGESYQEVDIESDLDLLKRYGIHVPVLLRCDSQQELFWPFGAAKLAAFMEAGP